MKARYRPSPNLEIEIESDSIKDIFTQLASAGETFGVGACGLCKSADIRYVVREVDGNRFPELKCNKCSARMAFGQSKDGKSIYPRVRAHKQHAEVKAGKLKEGDWLPSNGWAKFVSEKDDRQAD